MCLYMLTTTPECDVHLLRNATLLNVMSMLTNAPECDVYMLTNASECDVHAHNHS